MDAICYPFVRTVVEQYERELERVYSLPGVMVVDNSFLNGFVRRRLERDSIYLNLAEAWYAERCFHERQAVMALSDNKDDTPRYVTFPQVMVREFGRGIVRLVDRMGDPLSALTDRWGGAPGEPATVEYRLEALVDEAHVEAAHTELRGCVQALQNAQDLHRVAATELFVAPSPRYPQRFETRLGNALGRREKRKIYEMPTPHLHVAHYRKHIHTAGMTADHTREIETKPCFSRNFSDPLPQSETDREIYMLARAVGQRTPVTILTADNDFRSLHGFYSRNRPRKDPQSEVRVLLDHRGQPELLPA